MTTTPIRGLTAAAAMLLSGVLLAAQPASAGPGTNMDRSAPLTLLGHDAGHQVRLEPTPRADGMTRAHMTEQLMTFFYENPVDQPEPECLGLGRTGRVHLGAHDSTCTIEAGQPMFEGWANTCDSVTPPITPERRAQRACAINGDHTFIEALSVQVDNGPQMNLRQRRYEVVTSQFCVLIPSNNGFGVAPGPATVTAHAWVGLVQGLPLGSHRLRETVTFFNEEPFTIDKTVLVVP